MNIYITSQPPYKIQHLIPKIDKNKHVSRNASQQNNKSGATLVSPPPQISVNNTLAL